ncbi:MAG: YkvA family protein [Neomegalonema sp.]|nr:YkvA family protein [Neomegalonema sp.]
MREESERYRRRFEQDRAGFDRDKLGRLMGRLNDAEGSRGRLSFGRSWDDVKTVIRLLRAYWDGAYRDVPWGVISALGAALLYLITPIDFIPDLIPGLGFLDDVAIFALALDFARGDLERFREWELRRLGAQDAAVLRRE